MTASTSSPAIGEPFQFYLGSAFSEKTGLYDAIHCSYNREFPGYVTVTAQEDGIHIWDLKNLHAVASYSVGKNVLFAIPAFSLYVMENGSRLVISYATLAQAPEIVEKNKERIVWVIRQNLSGSSITANQKTVVVLDEPPVQMCGTGHDVVPLLLVSKNGSLSLANAQVEIKSRLDWAGERRHLKTFVFARKSCSFIRDDKETCSSVAITCCQVDKTMHVRLVLLGEEIIPVGTCEIPIEFSVPRDHTFIRGLTCSPSGVLSIIVSHGTWATYQLASLNSSLVPTPISENLHLQRFTIIKHRKRVTNAFAVVSLGTSLVLLAAFVDGSREIFLQIWDLSYGVILATQSIPKPSALRLPLLSLVATDEGQVLLTLTSSRLDESKNGHKRPSIYVIPVSAQLKSSLATALGKMTLTKEWLVPKISGNPEDDKSAKIISSVQVFLEAGNAQKAEQAFLKWVDSHSSKDAALGYEFVKKIFNIILSPEVNHSYTPRITRCLLENAVVSTIMLDGRLITTLRERGDWENLLFALTKVPDVSEDELMASAKFLIERQRRNENAMDIDTSEGYIPPFWTYLFACVSYPFTVAPVRLAIRKHIPDAQDLVMILEILENWLQGGTEHDMEVQLKSLATNTKIVPSKADSPPYPKVISFLQALLDASFVALLQYQPAHDVLRRILSYIETEIAFIDGLEPLRGVLEPFVKAQLLKERKGLLKESPTEWKRRRKLLAERADLDVGLYRLEELAI